jgi:hypothetical protein
VKSLYQFNLNFEVQRQYAKANPSMKSVRDAEMNVKGVTHYSSRLAQSHNTECRELEHTKFDAPFGCDPESEPEMTVACAVCPLKKELNNEGKEEVDHTFGQGRLCNIAFRIR